MVGWHAGSPVSASASRGRGSRAGAPARSRWPCAHCRHACDRRCLAGTREGHQRRGGEVAQQLARCHQCVAKRGGGGALSLGVGDGAAGGLESRAAGPALARRGKVREQFVGEGESGERLVAREGLVGAGVAGAVAQRRLGALTVVVTRTLPLYLGNIRYNVKGHPIIGPSVLRRSPSQSEECQGTPHANGASSAHGILLYTHGGDIARPGDATGWAVYKALFSQRPDPGSCSAANCGVLSARAGNHGAVGPSAFALCRLDHQLELGRPLDS